MINITVLRRDYTGVNKLLKGVGLKKRQIATIFEARAAGIVTPIIAHDNERTGVQRWSHVGGRLTRLGSSFQKGDRVVWNQ